MRGHSHLEMPLVSPGLGCSFSVLVTHRALSSDYLFIYLGSGGVFI